MTETGKRRLVLPAPPPLKRTSLHLSDQNEADNITPRAAPQWQQQQQQQQTQQPTIAAEHLSSDDEAVVDLPNDTEAALQLLMSQFKAKASIPPFALKSQLYTVLKDRTLVDRQLDELRLSNKLRLFQLPTGPDDTAIMPTANYAAALAASAQQLRTTKGALVHVFDWFRDRVLPACRDATITHRELLQLLATPPPAQAPFSNSGSGGGRTLATGASRRAAQVRGAAAAAAAASAVTEGHLSLLLHQGFLTRHSGGQDGYVFAMPGAGPAVRSIREGRAEIVQALQRRQYREIPEKELEKRKLQRSVLSMQFHIRDLLGSGALLRLDTTVGPVLRLQAARKL